MTTSGSSPTCWLALVSLAPLFVLACQSGPTAANHMEDAERAIDAARFDEARNHLDLAEKKGSPERTTRILRSNIERSLAERAAGRDDNEAVVDHYVTAGDLDPRRLNRARSYQKAVEIGRTAGMAPERLAAIAQKAVEANPSSPEAHRLHAQMWDEAGEAEKAIESYLWLWQADRTRTDVGRRLSALYRQLDRNRDAAAILRQLLESDPDNARAKLHLARLYAGMDKPDRARRLFEQVVDDHPDKPGVLLAYARFLSQHGETERARRLKQRAYDQMPGGDQREMRELQ